MRTCLLVIGLLALAPSLARTDDADDAKIKLAHKQITITDKKIDIYHVVNGQYPLALKALTEGKRPLATPEDLIDPWNKPYLYDPAGPKNNGEKPDLWTVTPDKKTIGNWELEKK